MPNIHRVHASSYGLNNISSSDTQAISGRTVVSTDHSFPHTSVAGIAAGATIFLLIIASTTLAMLRRHRRRRSARALPKSMVNILGWRKSADSESLTSFDTSTEDGKNDNEQREQIRLLSKTLDEAINEMKQYSPTQEFRVTDRVKATTSKISLLHQSIPISPHPQQISVQARRTSCDDGQMSPYPYEEIVDSYSTTPVRNASGSRSLLNLPRLTVPALVSYKQTNSVSESATAYQHRPLTPIIDETQTLTHPKTPYLISPNNDSPNPSSAISATSPSALLPLRQDGEIYSAGMRSSTTPFIKSSSRPRKGMAPISAQSKISIVSYLNAKPLPPYPQMTISPPMGLDPWSTSITGPPTYVPTRFRSLNESLSTRPATKTTTLKRRTRPFRELLSPSARTHPRSVSTISTRRHVTGPNIHISALAKRLPPVPSVQSPKPVLKLDTSGVTQETYLRPMWYPNKTTPSSVLPYTPISAARSAPPVFQSQHTNPFKTPVDQCPKSISGVATAPPGKPRPVSNAATIGSSILPQADEMSEVSEDDDTLDTPTTPLLPTPLFKYQPTCTSTWKSTSTINLSGLEYSPSLVTDMDIVGDDLNSDKRASRSPSIAVPIMFKLSVPRKSSRKFSAMHWG